MHQLKLVFKSGVKRTMAMDYKTGLAILDSIGKDKSAISTNGWVSVNAVEAQEHLHFDAKDLSCVILTKMTDQQYRDQVDSNNNLRNND